MSPPQTIKEATLDSIDTVACITSILSACALFSKTWIEIFGLGPQDIAKQLKDQQVVHLLSFSFIFFLSYSCKGYVWPS